jgi:hypothetical protein
MKRNHQELDAILDDTLAGIRRERTDQKTADTAASRVWARVSAEAAGLPEVLVAPSREVERISGCPDYRSLIPAYVRGQLSPARRLL